MATNVPLSADTDVSEIDFAKMMADELFVDFFNVFLSLPSFSQRMMYVFTKRDFEFDPPVGSRNVMIHRHLLVQWLLKERLPFFVRSEFFLDYLLCEQLLQIQPHLSSSSHRLDYEEFRILEDQDLVRSAIGHVIGMYNFHKFLEKTPGGQILSFWKDAERFNRIPSENKSIREACFRELQLKYFKPESGITTLQDNSLWEVLRDSDLAMDVEYENIGERRTPPSSFCRLQAEVMAVLKDYWLQRYLLHIFSKKTPPPVSHNSESNLQIHKDLKDIDKMLDMVRKKKPDKAMESQKALHNWHTMFPHTEIDDSFLQSTEDVVTIHKDNKITVCPAGSEFDMMLQRYFSDNDSDEEDISPSSPAYVPKWDMAPIRYKPEDHPEEQTKKLVSQIARAVKKKEQKQRNEPHNNLALFEHMILKKEAYECDGSDSIKDLDFDSQRPRTSGEIRPKAPVTKLANSLLDNFKLPSLEKRPQKEARNQRLKQKQMEYLEKRKKTTVSYFFPPILENVQSQSGGVNSDPPTTHKHADAKIMEFEFTNLCKGNYRQDNKLFICSIAVDAVCGRPFAAYLHRYNHIEALVAVRFWTEIHTYLSLKPVILDLATYEKVRFWRAHKMVVRFLNKDLPSPTNTDKESMIPTHVREYLRQMVLQGQGDDFLAMIQDFLCKELLNLWTSFSCMDKDNFEASTLVKRPKGLFHQPTDKSKKTPRLRVPKVEDEGLQEPVSLLRKYIRRVPLTKPDNAKATKIIRFNLAEVVEQVIDNENSNTSESGKQQNPENPTEDDRPSVPVRSQTSQTARQEKQMAGPRPKMTEKAKQKTKTASSTQKTKGGTVSMTLDNFLEELDLKGLEEKRMWKALRLVAYLTDLETDSLLLDPLPASELCYDKEEKNGSLSIQKTKTVRRRDLVEAEQRRKHAEVIAYNTRMALLRKKEEEDLPPEVLDDSIPDWAKPFKLENGRWAFRPNYPKSFNDIFKDQIRIEFFKRYLEAHGSAAPLNFWKEVESMKMAKDTVYRQQKISQILRRYFLSPKGYASLDCRDDVIKEIPKMEKVTAAMLISGQSCIAKQLEQQWFQAYQATFPEPADDEEDDGKKDVKRQWSTERSRSLWIQFVRTVMRFRHAVLNPEMNKDFADFLRLEILRETEKQKANGVNYVPGIPIKKVVRNKLIDITKLVNDLTFLAEAERFRSLCDNASDAAKQGIYKPDDQELLDIKANIIITCYLDSEIPPKIQINASADNADQVMACFQSGQVDRALFHELTVGIFPVLAFMWKKFQKFRYAQMFGAIKINEKTDPLLDRTVSPNFMDLKYTDGKTVVSLHEDDQPRMVFTLVNGLKVILPPTREQLLRRALDATLGRGVPSPTSLTEMPSTRLMTITMLAQPEQRLARSKSIRNKHRKNKGDTASARSNGSLSNSSSSDVSLKDKTNLVRRQAIFSRRAVPAAQ